VSQTKTQGFDANEDTQIDRTCVNWAMRWGVYAQEWSAWRALRRITIVAVFVFGVRDPKEVVHASALAMVAQRVGSYCCMDRIGAGSLR
jgi:hypothetical protein